MVDVRNLKHTAHKHLIQTHR